MVGGIAHLAAQGRTPSERNGGKTCSGAHKKLQSSAPDIRAHAFFTGNDTLYRRELDPEELCAIVTDSDLK